MDFKSLLYFFIQVTFYVDEFTRRETCFDFRVIRQVDVENVKPGTVKVYDYYQPEYFSTQVSQVHNSSYHVVLHNTVLTPQVQVLHIFSTGLMGWKCRWRHLLSIFQITAAACWVYVGYF